MNAFAAPLASLPLSDPLPTGWPDALATAADDTAALAQVLAQEFEVLKTRDLSALEALQSGKAELLQRLAQAAQWVANQTSPPAPWLQLQDALQQCKQDHLRNIQLLQRQLQAVKGTLQALQGESAASVDLYDRLGQVSRRHGVWSDLAA
jgi:flagellar biosynthesis/type III secretory pathway chaperone